VGSPGGSTIIASVSQTILNVIEHGMEIQDAILAPRIFTSGYPNVTWEAGIDQDVILQLMAKGHVFNEQPEHIGNVQAIIYDFETGKMYGGADNTREGTVLGVDAVAYTSAQPEPLPPAKAGPFVLKVNGHVYPYTAEQKALVNGTAYIEAKKLLLGLGASPSRFQKDVVTLGGKAFLPVKPVAEALGYTVSWDAKEAAVLLKKQ
jgi:gamma-glutamyltranspeptidase/glutathione hydrolase